MRPRPSRSAADAAGRAARWPRRARSSACSMFRGGGTPDNEPTLKTLANRKVTVDKDRRRRRDETKAIEAYRKFLDIAPKAPQRAEAMRRLGDLEMDSADSQSQGAERRGRRARLQGGDQALPGLPEDLSGRPEQRPRALPARARLRAGRRPRDGAEDARPAGQGLSGDALQRRGPVPPRRAAVHGARTTPAPRRRYATVLAARRREPVPRPRALHAGLVAVQAGPARGRR